MKRSAFLIAALLLTTLFEHGAVWAQQRPNGPGGGGQSGGQNGGGGQGRHIEDRRAQRQEMRRENIERRQEPAAQRNEQRNEPRNDPNTNRAPEGGNQQRMSPDERRQLREQVRNHGRDIYRDSGKR